MEFSISPVSNESCFADMAYLDNSATTPVCPEAAEAVARSLKNDWGNPSSLHGLGGQAAKELEKARAVVARACFCAPEEIVFTSGGTEADNLALFGAVKDPSPRKHIVASMVEHPAVYEAVRALEQRGCPVTWLRPGANGNISGEAVAAALREDTVLCSLMLVNNETGAVLPVRAAADAIKRRGLRTVLHVDAVQAFGKMQVSPSQLGADLMTISAHKIGGPKGVGALYVRRGVHLRPIHFGGGQERGLRPGTEPTPLIAGMAAACARLDVTAAPDTFTALRAYLLTGLAALPSVRVLSPPDAAPHIVSLSTPIRGETMLHYLENLGVYVGTGSACSRGKRSRVLQAMGIPDAVCDGAIRISFSRENRVSDIDRLLSGLRSGIAELAGRLF